MENVYKHYKTMCDKLHEEKLLFLKSKNIGENDAQSLAQALQGTKFTEFNLSKINIGCKGLKHIAQILKFTQITDLNLAMNNIGDEGIISLSDYLKDTKITKLDLSNNNIGCNGIKYLSLILKDIQITELKLANNVIRDKGAKYLTETLKDTQIRSLDLSENMIGIEIVQHLNEILMSAKLCKLCIDIYDTENSNVNKRLYRWSHYSTPSNYITLWSNKIGVKGAQYINKTFQNNEITQLVLDNRDLEEDDAEYLAQAFKGIKIHKLELFCNHITQSRCIQYLIEAFKNSSIIQLDLQTKRIGANGAQNLINFLYEIKVLELDLCYSYIGDDGMEYLADALRNSDVMYIYLAWNNITARGAYYLSRILRNSKLLYIDLKNNTIGVDGARYLADGLPYSQVTTIHLHNNMIEYEGYKHLINAVENTNITCVSLYGNNIEAGLEKGEHFWPKHIPRNTISAGDKLTYAFKVLVSLNPISNEFEFTVPKEKEYTNIDIDQYAFLIKTLKNDQNSRVHVFNMLCKQEENIFLFDLKTMNKINVFINTMEKQFIEFFGNYMPSIVEYFGIITEKYVKLLSRFEEMGLHDAVENLLLHRVLYYVDESHEILHPYIYKMLYKYNIPLFNKQLEPNKKEDIISYYQAHQEVDGAKEIIDLLESKNFHNFDN